VVTISGSSTSNVLQNGVPVSGLWGAGGSQQFWTMSVPAGASNLQFQTSGGTGDADLYVRFGSAPTTSTYDCGPVTGDNNELCSSPTSEISEPRCPEPDKGLMGFQR
jgi:hypothetical protein